MNDIQSLSAIECVVLRLIASVQPKTQNLQTVSAALAGEMLSPCAPAEVANVLARLEEKELLTSSSSETIRIVRGDKSFPSRVYSVTADGMILGLQS